MVRIATAAFIALPALGLLLAAQASGQTVPARRTPAPPAAASAPAVTIARTCSLANNALDDRIAACTQTINAGTGSQRERSLAAAYRGSAYRAKGDAARALADYDEAVRLDRANTVALNLRGLEFSSRGEYDRAIADFSEAIRIDPDDAAALTDRGLVYERQHDVARALTDFTAALARPARDHGAAAAQETAHQRMAALVAPKSAPASAAPVAAAPPLPGDIKPLARQRADAAPPVSGLGPAPAVPDSTLPRASASTNVVAIPRLPAERTGTAPALTPAETIAPDVNGLASARGAGPPVPPPPAHIPPLAQARTAAVAANPAPARPAAVAAPPGPATAAGAAVTASTPASVRVEPANRAGAARRIALVIGNASYLTLHYIPNPLNDAADMANALKQLGFAVTLGLDLRRTDMDDLLTRFAAEARTAETALVYYSGHGLQHMGENYLVPIDARVRDEADLRRLVRLADVIDDIAGARQNRIVILDASRDNEAGQQPVANPPAGQAAAFGRGLAKLADAAGTLVVSAGRPDEVTADGKGRNSPFTQALLKRMRETPGMAAKALMNAVREDVTRASGGAQRPDMAGGVADDFAFKTGP